MTTPLGSELLDRTIVFKLRSPEEGSDIIGGRITQVQTDETQVPTVRVYAANKNEEYTFELIEDSEIFGEANGDECTGVLVDYIVID